MVGAGTAASAIANWLSEVPSWRVLLIEAGVDPPMETNIPGLVASLWCSKYDWNYFVEKTEKACRSMNDNRRQWPRGKMLGGSSSTNTMVYVRGHQKDYHDWEKLGNPGWSQRCLKIFQKTRKIWRQKRGQKCARLRRLR